MVSQNDENSDVNEESNVTGNITEKIVQVDGIAILENCPDETLDKEYADSIRKLLFREQHLRENVFSSKFDILSSRSFRRNK